MSRRGGFCRRQRRYLLVRTSSLTSLQKSFEWFFTLPLQPKTLLILRSTYHASHCCSTWSEVQWNHDKEWECCAFWLLRFGGASRLLFLTYPNNQRKRRRLLFHWFPRFNVFGCDWFIWITLFMDIQFSGLPVYRWRRKAFLIASQLSWRRFIHSYVISHFPHTAHGWMTKYRYQLTPVLLRDLPFFPAVSKRWAQRTSFTNLQFCFFIPLHH